MQYVFGVNDNYKAHNAYMYQARRNNNYLSIQKSI